uniref:Uncharacterized protein n=1 Tax=Populus trichocarpa TaxID=3694 RepID=A0A2K1R8L7_POPTR
MTPFFGQKFLTIVMKIEFLYSTLVSFTMNIKLKRGVQTMHTSPKEQKHESLTCLNCKYTIQILHVTQGSRGHIIQRT